MPGSVEAISGHQIKEAVPGIALPDQLPYRGDTSFSKLHRKFAKAYTRAHAEVPPSKDRYEEETRTRAKIGKETIRFVDDLNHGRGIYNSTPGPNAWRSRKVSVPLLGLAPAPVFCTFEALNWYRKDDEDMDEHQFGIDLRLEFDCKDIGKDVDGHFGALADLTGIGQNVLQDRDSCDVELESGKLTERLTFEDIETPEMKSWFGVGIEIVKAVPPASVIRKS